MFGTSIVSRFDAFSRHFQPSFPFDLHNLYLHPGQLPQAVRHSPEAMRCLRLLGPLAWDHFPERDLQRNYGHSAIPFAALAAACLLKLELGMNSFSRLAAWLAQNPSISWLLGFRSPGGGFNPARNQRLDQRLLCRLLHKAPNSCFQFLLSSSVQTVLAEFARRNIPVPDSISLDTKHILAWVKENNPKVYVEERFDKTRQPAGDPDCKLGCKRRHNQTRSPFQNVPATPASNPVPAATIQVGEYYWGYASGVVAVKVPDWGEFVLAELTQPFDRPDVSFFFPLMAMVEQRLGFRPRFGALDAAFDAFYIYDYFFQAGGFAAVPLVEKGKTFHHRFDPSGLPLCSANLPMPLKAAYHDRSTAYIEYERGQYVCPLLFPNPGGEVCPIGDAHWANGGCLTTLSVSPGARIRHQLDRNSNEYKQLYNQRTAVERINSQAAELGIERPHLRNGQAITNLNTLIYTLINLHLLLRIQNQP